MPKHVSDDSGVPTLSELVLDRKQHGGYSYSDLEQRADGVITRQRWQQLGSGARVREFPEPSTITAMSTALGVDVAEVVSRIIDEKNAERRRRADEARGVA